MDPSHKPLSIMFWNTQSIRNTEIAHYLNTNEIDIVLFSETWLKQNHNISIPNFKFYRNDRVVPPHANNSRTIGGGVGIAIRNSLRHTIIPNINTKVIESIGVEVKDNGNTVRLVSVYFSGKGLNNSKLNQFKSDIQILTSSTQNFLICGKPSWKNIV